MCYIFYFSNFIAITDGSTAGGDVPRNGYCHWRASNFWNGSISLTPADDSKLECEICYMSYETARRSHILNIPMNKPCGCGASCKLMIKDYNISGEKYEYLNWRLGGYWSTRTDILKIRHPNGIKADTFYGCVICGNGFDCYCNGDYVDSDGIYQKAVGWKRWLREHRRSHYGACKTFCAKNNVDFYSI